MTCTETQIHREHRRVNSGHDAELIFYCTRSAYSLSGHVSVSVLSPYSMFDRRRPARLLLQSLTLTFEGQNEMITSEVGYSAMRLCSITREIAPCEPVELSNEGHEESDDPCELYCAHPVLILY